MWMLLQLFFGHRPPDTGRLLSTLPHFGSNTVIGGEVTVHIAMLSRGGFNIILSTYLRMVVSYT
jgi:hypothetical protein